MEAKWFSLGSLPDLAFDHDQMIHEALHLLANHANYVADKTDDVSVKEVLGKLSHSC